MVLTLNAATLTETHHVLVYRTILARLQAADQNVLSTQNAKAAWLASKRNVETLAQDLAEAELNAQ